MTLNDSIAELFKLGCTRVTFGLDDHQELCIAAEQVVKTANGVSNHVHQLKGESPVDLAAKALALVRHGAEMKSGLVVLPRGNGR